MAKPFGKQPSDWTKLKSTKNFLSTFMTVRNIFRTEDYQVVIQGGSGKQGTWFIREVALEFARWLDTKFKPTSP